MSGSRSGTAEAMALVTSRSLTKSRPFWDMRIDVKASSADRTWEREGTKRRETKRRRSAAEAGGDAMRGGVGSERELGFAG